MQAAVAALRACEKAIPDGGETGGLGDVVAGLSGSPGPIAARMLSPAKGPESRCQGESATALCNRASISGATSQRKTS